MLKVTALNDRSMMVTVDAMSPDPLFVRGGTTYFAMRQGVYVGFGVEVRDDGSALVDAATSIGWNYWTTAKKLGYDSDPDFTVFNFDTKPTGNNELTLVFTDVNDRVESFEYI